MTFSICRTGKGVPLQDFDPRHTLLTRTFDTLIYVLYAFGNVDPTIREVQLPDPYADIQKHYPGDSWDEPRNNIWSRILDSMTLTLTRRPLSLLKMYLHSIPAVVQRPITWCCFYGKLWTGTLRSPSNYQSLHLAEMDQYIDFWNLMAYDYSTPFNTDQAIAFYISNGVDPSKINLGIPLYDRSFLNTEGPGTSYNSVGPGK
ncbi:Endochitinase [Rasamsonia emersonii CBS 393.64]|uniref:Endochitinase n=1 Tax=Rasamsonia emersonii (strain ATCC 16479 / CBS 393.64 / IMI 116815) TaxID=1408163 RepID=A0A0F4Z0F1_RASE3|nr:Endochitinase [Rasamsonia emersonii CBS 393.64]KKA23343.1 Endochitinase [Rasamsonia emersonii CBS 393.64]